MAHSHRPTGLKQTNKPFKGGKHGKCKGKEETKAKKKSTLHKDLSKQDRKHQAMQQAAAKRAVLQAERRQFQGREGAGRLVAVLPAAEGVDLTSLVAPFAPTINSQTCTWYSEGQRMRFTLLHPIGNDPVQICMQLSMADIVLIVTPSTDLIVSPMFEQVSALLRAQGIPPLCAITDDRKLRADWLRCLQVHLPTLEQVKPMAELERTLACCRLHAPRWLEDRPFMMAESVEQQGDIVCLEGFIRGGKAFSAQRLVHLPLLNQTVIVERIEAAMSFEQRDPEKAEPLNTTPDLDINDDDAMWEAQEQQQQQQQMQTSQPKVVKKRLVPKGTSAYQAAWFLDDDEDDDFEEEIVEEVAVEERPVGMEEADDVEDADLLPEVGEEERREEAIRGKKHFPDAVEVPMQMSARERFARYRGLSSLRKGEWDEEEGLPAEYGRIYRFANWKRSQAKAIADDADSPWQVGQRVRMYLRIVDVSSQLRIVVESQPWFVVGLHRHEQRMSLLNMAVTVNYQIGHKEPLIAVIGCRQFNITPLWSEHNPNLPLHRRLRGVDAIGTLVMATAYLPISMGSSPVLLFNQMQQLVAHGHVYDCNPNRIILKRITLCATPFRVNKRTVVARFMFNQPSDIYWFRPVELVTRSGKRGHIIESLGTHGYMKCLFDQQIQHGDVIGMHLYKRVFPKW